MLRGVLLNAEPVLGDILDGSFYRDTEREIRQEYSPVLTEMAMWMTCTVMDELYCHGCTGLSVQWRQRRQLGGGKKFLSPK